LLDAECLGMPNKTPRQPSIKRPRVIETFEINARLETADQIERMLDAIEAASRAIDAYDRATPAEPTFYNFI
jgi:hypothetical protein